jgi:hypothetical protein
MKRSLLVLLLVCPLLCTTAAFASCDQSYGMCVSSCATSNTPERCVQRCQQSLDRCSKSGVFQMPISFNVRAEPELNVRTEATRPLQRRIQIAP